MCERLIPGTKIPYSGENRSFAYFLPLIRAADGLTLSQVCTVTGLETSTVQNWVKRGFVPHPIQKKYRERHLARILLITALRDSMQIDRVGELFRLINGNTDDESDDIISEEELYDIFCSVVSKVSEKVFSEEETGRIIRSEIKGWEPPSADAPERLEKALTVMVYAYTAGLFRQKCEEAFGLLAGSP